MLSGALVVSNEEEMKPGCTPPEGRKDPDLEQVRSEVHGAVERARHYLEWAEISRVLTPGRIEESATPTCTNPPPEPPPGAPFNVLLVQPRLALPDKSGPEPAGDPPSTVP